MIWDRVHLHLLYIEMWLSQHHLLKNPTELSWYLCWNQLNINLRAYSSFSILFHWFICLFLCQYHILITVVWNQHIFPLSFHIRFNKPWDFPGGSADKESACNVGDLGSIPGLGRSPVEGIGYPLQFSGLGNCMDCVVHGVAKSQTRLSNFHFLLK